MAFPNFIGKHSKDSMFTAKDFLANSKRDGWLPKINIARNILICYSSKLVDHIQKKYKIKHNDLAGGKYFRVNDEFGVIADFGIGAPAAVVIMEELCAMGAENFINVGTAGTLSKNLHIGDIVVCSKSVRDEGTSHHYIQPSKYSFPTGNLTKKLRAKLKKHAFGPSWTIDAPYRETVAEARSYQRQGILTVEMEVSAMFAMAQYHKVNIAAAFVISDSLSELKWKPKMEDRKVHEGLIKIYLAAAAAFRDI